MVCHLLRPFAKFYRRVMYIAPSSGLALLNLNLPFKLILRGGLRLFSNVWSENAALLKDWWKFIQIHQYYTMALIRFSEFSFPLLFSFTLPLGAMMSRCYNMLMSFCHPWDQGKGMRMIGWRNKQGRKKRKRRKEGEEDIDSEASSDEEEDMEHWQMV